jgi:transposase
VGLPADHCRLRRREPRTREGVTDHSDRPAAIRAASRAERTGHPGALPARRADDVLAYFTHRASNGPTEAINGRLEALRRNALGSAT